MLVSMKPVTITLPEDLHERAAAEARRQGISTSELIRRGLDAVLPEPEDREEDHPWKSLAGFGSAEVAVEAGEIDDVVYGR